MTRDEFDIWTADLCRKFPAIAKWLEGMGEAATGLLGEWAGVLSWTDVKAAMEANRRMLAGDEGDLPGEFPSAWQSIPAQVRRIAGRATRTSATTAPEQIRKPSIFPAGKILRRVVELREAGTPSAEAREIALKEFPIGHVHSEPRFRCYLCQDTQFITVASRQFIIAVLDGTVVHGHHREAVMWCSCHSGESNRKLERYDESLDFRVIDSCWPASEVERFTAWVHDRKEQAVAARLASYEWTPDKSRHREFAP